MAKEDEIAYIERLGPLGREHALNKPWSDVDRGRYLQEIGALITLLPQPPARVLDLGAGSGWTSCLLAMSGYQVTATDIAPEMVAMHGENAMRYDVRLEASLVTDFESLPFDNEFDVVIFYDCLHHSDDELAALRGAHRALRPGGICVTLEPGRGHHKTDMSVNAMRLLGVTERDMPPSLIVSSGRKAGFTSHAVHDRPLDPLLITTGRWPRLSTLYKLTKRYLGRATPLVMTRGHFVVLTK
ncbi:MAG: methyltransferase domain-containing protein [Actinobacteria bacterium]|nr:methyltransferase domain-containing protein [Actinomycetota bacterium]